MVQANSRAVRTCQTNTRCENYRSARVKWGVPRVWLQVPSSLRTHSEPLQAVGLPLKPERDALEDNEALETQTPNGKCNITCNVAR